MGLIKSTLAPSSMTPFSMQDIEQQAKVILLRARQQADQLLAAAQAQAIQIKAAAKVEGMADARIEGLAQGIKQGRDAGRQEALNNSRAEFQYAVTAFASAASELEASRAELNAGASQEVVRLAVAIARRVIKRQGAFDPQVLLANLSEVMKLVSDASNVRVAIHPTQRKTIDEVLPRLALTYPALKHVELVEEQSLSPGDCRVYTRNGQIDADLDVQLDRIAADLLPAPDQEVA